MSNTGGKGETASHSTSHEIHRHKMFCLSSSCPTSVLWTTHYFVKTLSNYSFSVNNKVFFVVSFLRNFKNVFKFSFSQLPTTSTVYIALFDLITKRGIGAGEQHAFLRPTSICIRSLMRHTRFYTGKKPRVKWKLSRRESLDISWDDKTFWNEENEEFFESKVLLF